jgi:hypothetical protein
MLSNYAATPVRSLFWNTSAFGKKEDRMLALFKLLLKVVQKAEERKVRRVTSWATWTLEIRHRKSQERDAFMEQKELELADYWKRQRGEVSKVVPIRKSKGGWASES